MAALQAKDDFTARHARQIAGLAESVGQRLGLSGGEIDDLRFGAAFHDIGKIAIPDRILNKTAELSADERATMEAHPAIGERIVAPMSFLSPGVPTIVRHHHERWDGRGYPDRLRGEAIPLGSQIVLVVDAFHAMTSDRPYRRAVGVPQAARELRANAGGQFDPRVVRTFLSVIDRES